MDIKNFAHRLGESYSPWKNAWWQFDGYSNKNRTATYIVELKDMPGIYWVPLHSSNHIGTTSVDRTKDKCFDNIEDAIIYFILVC